jgi:hypothetical protein
LPAAGRSRPPAPPALAAQVDAELFAMAKERAETDYRNRRFQQPYAHALLASHRVLESPFFTPQERLRAMGPLEVQRPPPLHAPAAGCVARVRDHS